jgi:hypothetical protein
MNVVALGPGMLISLQIIMGGSGSGLTEVEEELDEDVKPEFVVTSKILEIETPYDEENGEDDETSKLNGLTSNGINGCHCRPVPGNSSSRDENAISSSEVVKDLIHSWSSTISNRGENSGTIQTEAIEGNIEEEP